MKPVRIPPGLASALQALVDEDLTVWEACALVGIGEKPDCSLRDLVARWGRGKPTLYSAYRRLVEQGLVDARPGAGNLVRLRLTEAGRARATQLSTPSRPPR